MRGWIQNQEVSQVKQRPLKRLLVLSCLVLGIGHEGKAMAVYDATSCLQIAKQVAEAEKLLTEATKQVQRLDSQINQAKEHYNALTGERKFGDIHDSPNLRQFLPEKLDNLYAAAERGMTALQGLKNTIKNEEKFGGSVDEMQRHIENRMETAALTDKAFNLHAYEGLKERTKQIDKLMAEIKQTNDPKDIADLQARIAIEQAHIQNETTKLQIIDRMQRGEQFLIELQKYRMSRRILKPDNPGMPKIR